MKNLKRKSWARRKIEKIRKENEKKLPDAQKKFELIGIAFFAVSLICICGLIGFNVGFVGDYFAKVLRYFFGVGAWLSALIIAGTGVYSIMKHSLSKSVLAFWVFFILCLAVFHHFAVEEGGEILPANLINGGGFAGGILVFLLRKIVGTVGGLIILAAGTIAALLTATAWSLKNGILRTKDSAQRGIRATREKIEDTYKHITEPKEETEYNQITALTEETPKDDFTPEYTKKNSFYNQMTDTSFQKAADNDEQEIVPVEKEDLKVTAQPRKKYNFFPAMPKREQKEEVEEEAFPFGQSEDTSYDEANEKADKTDTGISNIVEEINLSDEHEETIKELAEEYGNDEKAAAFIASLPTDDEVLNDDISSSQDEFIDIEEDEAEKTEIIREDELTEKLEEDSYEVSNVEAEAENNHNGVSALQSNVSDDAFDDEDTSRTYVLPKVSEILTKQIKHKNEEIEKEIANNSQILARTLESFKVKATIINYCHGPAVTRYELEPAPGVKVSKIANLSDDLALALAAFSVRIEPVPGKAAIGIEVPNKELEGVRLREVLEIEAFVKAKSALTVGLGMDIGGEAILADLAKMPHLLVAGATGSGKSVCINTIIASVLFKAKPDEVKFILIDPKMVELSNYNGIPHLMVPVVTDAKKAASVLNWAVQEMEKRYSIFADSSVRNIESYNKLDIEEKMPSLVIIIDELADLMMVAPHDVEDAICRLAQKARAAGIHLVLATQRPSVDVITGIIKANIPSRISFAVSSQIDSRTILDMGGAEKLLGKGDMLFYPIGASKPHRVQGALVSDEEVERLLEFIKAQGQEAETNEEIIKFTENEEAEDKKEKKDKLSEQDELLPEAVKLVLSTGQASSSSIQRRFRIGYTRAARIVDTMESLGIVGAASGSKPREILMTTEQALEALSNEDNLSE